MQMPQHSRYCECDHCAPKNQLIKELETKVARLEREKAEQYQRAQFYRSALQEIRDNTPANQPDCWPHHHWYLSKASKAINHVALEGKQEKERCPHLAGDLCIKEGACECYGAEGKQE